MSDEKPKNSGRFAKGNPGKPKGAVTKSTAQIKDMILQALSEAGGVQYLTERANDPKTASAFLTLIGKVLPMQVQTTDANGEPLSIVVAFAKPKDAE